MANKAISELPQALNVNNQDLFVLEQSGIAKKLTAETFITEQGIIDALAEALDGHGGISSVTLSSVSGRIRTYLITFTDETTTTFQVLDGTSISRIEKTSTAGLVDTYTVFMTDGTTSFFQVRNGQDGSATWDQINGKAPAITDTASGAIATIPDGAEDIPVTSLVANIEPKQSGSGDPSPSNIRPITGWTGCNVTRAGKNLFDINKMVDTAGITVNNGVIYVSGNSRNSTKKLGELADLIVGETYTLSATTTATQYIIYLYGTGANVTWNFGTARTITQEMLNALVFFYGGSGTAQITDFMIRPASVTDTTFVPYITPSTVTVDWSTEAGTVYGGTIDVATGLLTVTDGYIASYNGETLPSTWISDRDVYSSGTTPTTGAQVVYALATSQTYQLSGQQLATFLGTNNVWADTGDTSVTYTADTKLYIEKLTMPTEDDLVANQAITSGKFFMVGNNLYIATAAIASGAKIIEGTNATRLSLADALNRL